MSNKDMFDAEKKLLEFLAKYHFLVGCKDDFKFEKYLVGKTELEHPPKFIHAIVSLQGNITALHKVKSDIATLQQKFLDTAPGKRLPSRFPVLLEQPMQINLSEHNAYRSRMITPESDDFIQIKRLVGDENASFDIENELKNDSKLLEEIGIGTKIVKRGKSFSLHMSTESLLEKENAAKMTVREQSGKQFTARVRYEGRHSAERLGYGVLVIPDDCEILRSLPQAKKSHSLDESTKKIEIPIECPCEFYIRD